MLYIERRQTLYKSNYTGFLRTSNNGRVEMEAYVLRYIGNQTLTFFRLIGFLRLFHNMFEKDKKISLFFSDLESAISNQDVFKKLTKNYIYLDSTDECGITISPRIMEDFGRDILETVRRICSKHGMPDPTNDLNQ